MSKSEYLKTKKCVICGKEFIPPCASQYVYKVVDKTRKVQYCCSYTCWTKYKNN